MKLFSDAQKSGSVLAIVAIVALFIGLAVDSASIYKWFFPGSDQTRPSVVIDPTKDPEFSDPSARLIRLGYNFSRDPESQIEEALKRKRFAHLPIFYEAGIYPRFAMLSKYYVDSDFVEDFLEYASKSERGMSVCDHLVRIGYDGKINLWSLAGLIDVGNAQYIEGRCKKQLKKLKTAAQDLVTNFDQDLSRFQSVKKNLRNIESECRKYYNPGAVTLRDMFQKCMVDLKKMKKYRLARDHFEEQKRLAERNKYAWRSDFLKAADKTEYIRYDADGMDLNFSACSRISSRLRSKQIYFRNGEPLWDYKKLARDGRTVNGTVVDDFFQESIRQSKYRCKLQLRKEPIKPAAYEAARNILAHLG